MTAKERAEHRRLCRKWATGRATRKQIERCMELSQKSRDESRPHNYPF